MMNPNEKASHGGSRGAAGAMARNQHDKSITARRQTKQSRIIAELAHGGSLNRFEAEKIGDHALPSTVARIETYGIKVSRRIEKVPGYEGHTTRVCRYWLDDENRVRAAAMLGL